MSQMKDETCVKPSVKKIEEFLDVVKEEVGKEVKH